MATEVKIPSLGESISSGILATWHVKDGDYVEADDPIFELETDKITSEGNAEVSGVIELKAEEGDEVEVGSVVAVIDESASKPGDDDSTEESTGEPEEEDGDKEEPEGKEDGSKDKADTGDDGESAGKTKQHPASVRRLAEESGIDPDSVEGSGKGGRVTKGDMLEAIEASEKSPDPEEEAIKDRQPKSFDGKPEDKDDRETRKKMTPLRKTIAQRLVSAQQTTAMLTTFNEVDMSAVMNFRKTHQDAFVKKHDVKLGFMSFFTKAVVHALRAYPGVNARIEGEEIVTNHYFDIGIAVSTPKGLLVPVIPDCDRKSFAEIEKDIISYANKAKDGKITIDDLQGGVFTITNGGIFGSMLSTPILNTPQSGILGMHTIQERPVAVNGEVKIRPMMYLALSYDHRLVDGREAVGFLVSVKQVIEDPMRLMFEI